MFGRPVRAPRPVVYILVYGAFLAVVGVTAMAHVALVSAHFSTSALNTIVGNDAGVVQAFANENLLPSDLSDGRIPPERATDVRDAMAAFTSRRGILRAEVRLPDGTVLASSDGTGLDRATMSPEFSRALGNEVAAAIRPAGESDATGPLDSSTVIQAFLPLRNDGEVLGVIGIWRDAQPIAETLGAVQRDVVIVTLTAALLAAAVLFLVFRAAQSRITRQTEQIVELGRRDPLTGTLNHGSLVAALADAIEASRSEGGGIGLALVDVDNFRLLNDTRGHAKGDEVIRIVLEELRRELPDHLLLGRYGPDELLLVTVGAATAGIGPGLERLRAALADVALEVGGEDPLPITVSAAVCTYPEHGASVTELLANAAVALQEAKASGGDAIRFAGASDQAADARSFDVFQGLILAVDTKDRYTKRHSEDVARYGSFLAEQLGLETRQAETIRLAGLLHDVGKIGIPVSILRKPGKLTDAEFEVVKQHVALGDMIVRDLPDIEQIRAGIRHHHERVDGRGYLHALAGEDIPLVARILAIADAFSAMTTSRPYRKALDVREALTRLGDAAGSQLDERLVEVFIRGIETAPHAPLPGVEAAPTLWTPIPRVA